MQVCTVASGKSHATESAPGRNPLSPSHPSPHASTMSPGLPRIISGTCIQELCAWSASNDTSRTVHASGIAVAR
jgi:hypothetical protein